MSHLHWAYRNQNAAKLLVGLSSGLSLCSKLIPVGEFTTADKVTCLDCIMRHQQPPAPEVAAPKPVAKPKTRRYRR